MTSLSRFVLNCPKCDTEFSVIYFLSLNTWMDPSSAKDFLDGKGYYFKCPSCDQNIRLVTEVLVNTLRGMFNISTNASREEKLLLYKQYGLLDENNEFKNPFNEWILNQRAKFYAPDDTDTQRRRQEKLVEEINVKIQLYKQFIKERKVLDDEQERSFKDLQIRWENERLKGETYLHKPNTIDVRTTKNLLFLKLWEDLVQLKLELEELK